VAGSTVDGKHQVLRRLDVTIFPYRLKMISAEFPGYFQVLSFNVAWILISDSSPKAIFNDIRRIE
jgi:hypothetical protein